MSTHNLPQIPIATNCPYCNSTKFIRNGKSKNIQCYKCKECNKRFKDTTNTPLHWLHKKEKVGKYLEALKEGISVRKAAKYTGISKNTSFNWRHKFLCSLNGITPETKNNEISGAAIIDLPFSNKGSTKHQDKLGQTVQSLLIITNNDVWIKKINTKQQPVKLAKEIEKRIVKGNITIVPNKKLTSAIQHQDNIDTISNKLLSKKLVKTINDKVEALTKWMERFQGVASKYLQHYWDWFVSLEESQQQVNGYSEFCQKAISSKNLKSYFILKGV